MQYGAVSTHAAGEKLVLKQASVALPGVRVARQSLGNTTAKNFQGGWNESGGGSGLSFQTEVAYGALRIIALSSACRHVH